MDEKMKKENISFNKKKMERSIEAKMGAMNICDGRSLI